MKWPNCEPGEAFCNMNGVNYRTKEMSPGKWQWVIDEEAQRQKQEMESRKYELGMALQTRVLTEDEMQEVMFYGINLFTREMVPYYEDQVQKKFNEAICRQYRLRKIAKEQA